MLSINLGVGAGQGRVQQVRLAEERLQHNIIILQFKPREKSAKRKFKNTRKKTQDNSHQSKMKRTRNSGNSAQ